MTEDEGMEALECVLKTEIALVLMDVSMPRMNGFETAEMIHGHPRFPPRSAGSRMHFLVITLVALQSPTIIDVQQGSPTTLRVRIDDTIYTAEFSPRVVKGKSLPDGEQLLADIKDGKMTVTVSGKTVGEQPPASVKSSECSSTSTP